MKQRWHGIPATGFDLIISKSGVAFGVGFGLGPGDDEALLNSQEESSTELTLEGAHLVGRDADAKPTGHVLKANRI